MLEFEHLKVQFILGKKFKKLMKDCFLPKNFREFFYTVPELQARDKISRRIYYGISQIVFQK